MVFFHYICRPGSTLGFAFPNPSSTLKEEMVLVTGWLQLGDVTTARLEAWQAWLGLTPEQV